MELLPPSEPEPIMRRVRKSPAARMAFFAFSGASCFGFVLWGLNQFLSLRGVVHVAASRIVLVLTAFVAVLGLWAFTRLLTRKRNLCFAISAVVVVVSGFWLDW